MQTYRGDPPCRHAAQARLTVPSMFLNGMLRLVDLAQRLAGTHGHRERKVQASTAAWHRDRDAMIRRRVDMLRDAGGFAAEQEDVLLDEIEAGVRLFRLGGEKDQPALVRPPPVLETIEVDVTGEGRHFEIVHSGTAQRPVRHVEACRLDDVDGDAETGAEAQDRSGIAGNVRLIEGDAQISGQFGSQLNCGRAATPCQDGTENPPLAVAICGEAVYRADHLHSNRRRREWNS